MLSDLTYLDTPAPLWLAAFFVSTLLLAIGLLLHLCYRAGLWLLPPALALGGLVLTGAGRRLLARFSLVDLTRLSVVRIPVELCLYALAARSLVPDTMTFADRNLDLAAGLTAPLAAYWFRTQLLDRRLLLIWHVGALALLLNVVVLAALSLPTPWQQMSFGQPNVAVLRLPFVWLPTFIVPLVLFSHVAALRQLLVPVAHITAHPSGRAGQWHLEPWFIDQAGNRRRTGLGRFLRPRADRKPTGPAAR